MIKATGLSKRYGEVLALDNVDLEVSGGSIVGVLGPNGAGKTTAIRILTTLTSPDSGQARVAGEHVADQPRAELRRRRGGREKDGRQFLRVNAGGASGRVGGASFSDFMARSFSLAWSEK